MRPPACPHPRAGAAYTNRMLGALRAREDVWGNELLAHGEPSYARATRFLAPLLLARGPGGRPLTRSGVYYLPFAQPDGARGAGSVALHVADGGEIVAQKIGGPSLEISVGNDGGERFGSCLERLSTPALGGGYLPILETGYRDADGARYRQESFAARDSGSGRLASYVRIAVGAGHAGAQVRLSPSHGRAVTVAVPPGARRTVYARWPGGGSPQPIAPSAYAAARAGVVAYWHDRLGEGMRISVPEPRVENAWRALLVQELELTWRYSIGNPYEEFSFPESVDVAQVMAEQGFEDVARSMLRTSLTRQAEPYANWKRGERLLASAEYFRLTGDRGYVTGALPALQAYVTALGRQIDGDHGGLLARERYSSDIPNDVYGLHSQAVAWAGLRAAADTFDANGRPALARRSRELAARLGDGLRRAVRRSQRRLPDGSLFLPARLLDDEEPYGSVTQERLGSYWNLVVPYALASGFFAPGSAQARGALAYMLRHGSRLLGLVRAGGYALYGREAEPPASGTDEVYGINVARFLADNHQADQLVLSLYGDLAAGMTRGTYVSGEAASVAPLDGERFRAMYLPPNSAANATFLEMLRLMLVHETADANGRPRGLELAYSTPRAWLAPGDRIAVTNAPTSFGPLSYSIARAGETVRIAVDVPAKAPRTLSLRLRLRLPKGMRIGRVELAGRAYPRVVAATGTIDLSRLEGRLDLVAHLSHSHRRP